MAKKSLTERMDKFLGGAILEGFKPPRNGMTQGAQSLRWLGVEGLTVSFFLVRWGMRSLLIRVVFLCALLLPSPLWATDMIRMPSANVLEVYDGDTFKVQLPGMLDVFGHEF